MQVTTAMVDHDKGMVVKRVSIPVGLEEMMEGLTKEVLKKKPKDVYNFAAEYFAQLLTNRDGGLYLGSYIQRKQTSTEISAKHNNQPRKSKSVGSVTGRQHLSRQVSIRHRSNGREADDNNNNGNKVKAEKDKSVKKQKGTDKNPEDTKKKSENNRKESERNSAGKTVAFKGRTEDMKECPKEKIDSGKKKPKRQNSAKIVRSNSRSSIPKTDSFLEEECGEMLSISGKTVKMEELKQTSHQDPALKDIAVPRSSSTDEDRTIKDASAPNDIKHNLGVQTALLAAVPALSTALLLPPTAESPGNDNINEDIALCDKPEDVLMVDEENEAKIGRTSYDASVLREELERVEQESKYSSFKTSYNPYILRNEIRSASKDLESGEMEHNALKPGLPAETETCVVLGDNPSIFAEVDKEIFDLQNNIDKSIAIIAENVPSSGENLEDILTKEGMGNKLDQAATKIQAGVRGYLFRKITRVSQASDKSIDESNIDPADAVQGNHTFENIGENSQDNFRTTEVKDVIKLLDNLEIPTESPHALDAEKIQISKAEKIAEVVEGVQHELVEPLSLLHTSELHDQVVYLNEEGEQTRRNAAHELEARVMEKVKIHIEQNREDLNLGDGSIKEDNSSGSLHHTGELHDTLNVEHSFSDEGAGHGEGILEDIVEIPKSIEKDTVVFEENNNKDLSKLDIVNDDIENECKDADDYETIASETLLQRASASSNNSAPADHIHDKSNNNEQEANEDKEQKTDVPLDLQLRVEDLGTNKPPDSLEEAAASPSQLSITNEEKFMYEDSAFSTSDLENLVDKELVEKSSEEIIEHKLVLKDNREIEETETSKLANILDSSGSVENKCLHSGEFHDSLSLIDLTTCTEINDTEDVIADDHSNFDDSSLKIQELDAHPQELRVDAEYLQGSVPDITIKSASPFSTEDVHQASNKSTEEFGLDDVNAPKLEEGNGEQKPETNLEKRLMKDIVFLEEKRDPTNLLHSSELHDNFALPKVLPPMDNVNTHNQHKAVEIEVEAAELNSGELLQESTIDVVENNNAHLLENLAKLETPEEDSTLDRNNSAKFLENERKHAPGFTNVEDMLISQYFSKPTSLIHSSELHDSIRIPLRPVELETSSEHEVISIDHEGLKEEHIVGDIHCTETVDATESSGLLHSGEFHDIALLADGNQTRRKSEVYQYNTSFLTSKLKSEFSEEEQNFIQNSEPDAHHDSSHTQNDVLKDFASGESKSALGFEKSQELQKTNTSTTSASEDAQEVLKAEETKNTNVIKPTEERTAYSISSINTFLDKEMIDSGLNLSPRSATHSKEEISIEKTQGLKIEFAGENDNTFVIENHIQLHNEENTSDKIDEEQLVVILNANESKEEPTPTLTNGEVIYSRNDETNLEVLGIRNEGLIVKNGKHAKGTDGYVDIQLETTSDKVTEPTEFSVGDTEKALTTKPTAPNNVIEDENPSKLEKGQSELDKVLDRLEKEIQRIEIVEEEKAASCKADKEIIGNERLTETVKEIDNENNNVIITNVEHSTEQTEHEVHGVKSMLFNGQEEVAINETEKETANDKILNRQERFMQETSKEQFVVQKNSNELEDKSTKIGPESVALQREVEVKINEGIADSGKHKDPEHGIILAETTSVDLRDEQNTDGTHDEIVIDVVEKPTNVQTLEAKSTLASLSNEVTAKASDIVGEGDSVTHKGENDLNEKLCNIEETLDVGVNDKTENFVEKTVADTNEDDTKEKVINIEMKVAEGVVNEEKAMEDGAEHSTIVKIAEVVKNTVDVGQEEKNVSEYDVKNKAEESKSNLIFSVNEDIEDKVDGQTIVSKEIDCNTKEKLEEAESKLGFLRNKVTEELSELSDEEKIVAHKGECDTKETMEEAETNLGVLTNKMTEDLGGLVKDDEQSAADKLERDAKEKMVEAETKFWFLTSGTPDNPAELIEQEKSATDKVVKEKIAEVESKLDLFNKKVIGNVAVTVEAGNLVNDSVNNDAKEKISEVETKVITLGQKGTKNIGNLVEEEKSVADGMEVDTKAKIAELEQQSVVEMVANIAEGKTAEVETKFGTLTNKVIEETQPGFENNVPQHVDSTAVEEVKDVMVTNIKQVENETSDVEIFKSADKDSKDVSVGDIKHNLHETQNDQKIGNEKISFNREIKDNHKHIFNATNAENESSEVLKDITSEIHNTTKSAHVEEDLDKNLQGEHDVNKEHLPVNEKARSDIKMQTSIENKHLQNQHYKKEVVEDSISKKQVPLIGRNRTLGDVEETSSVNDKDEKGIEMETNEGNKNLQNEETVVQEGNDEKEETVKRNSISKNDVLSLGSKGTQRDANEKSFPVNEKYEEEMKIETTKEINNLQNEDYKGAVVGDNTSETEVPNVRNNGTLEDICEETFSANEKSEKEKTIEPNEEGKHLENDGLNVGNNGTAKDLYEKTLPIKENDTTELKTSTYAENQPLENTDLKVGNNEMLEDVHEKPFPIDKNDKEELKIPTAADNTVLQNVHLKVGNNETLEDVHAKTLPLDENDKVEMKMATNADNTHLQHEDCTKQESNGEVNVLSTEDVKNNDLQQKLVNTPAKTEEYMNAEKNYANSNNPIASVDRNVSAPLSNLTSDVDTQENESPKDLVSLHNTSEISQSLGLDEYKQNSVDCKNTDLDNKNEPTFNKLEANQPAQIVDEKEFKNEQDEKITDNKTAVTVAQDRMTSASSNLSAKVLNTTGNVAFNNSNEKVTNKIFTSHVQDSMTNPVDDKLVVSTESTPPETAIFNASLLDESDSHNSQANENIKPVFDHVNLGPQNAERLENLTQNTGRNESERLGSSAVENVNDRNVTSVQCETVLDKHEASNNKAHVEDITGNDNKTVLDASLFESTGCSGEPNKAKDIEVSLKNSSGNVKLGEQGNQQDNAASNEELAPKNFDFQPEQEKSEQKQIKSANDIEETKTSFDPSKLRLELEAAEKFSSSNFPQEATSSSESSTTPETTRAINGKGKTTPTPKSPSLDSFLKERLNVVLNPTTNISKSPSVGRNTSPTGTTISSGFTNCTKSPVPLENLSGDGAHSGAIHNGVNMGSELNGEHGDATGDVLDDGNSMHEGGAGMLMEGNVNIEPLSLQVNQTPAGAKILTSPTPDDATASIIADNYKADAQASLKNDSSKTVHASAGNTSRRTIMERANNSGKSAIIRENMEEVAATKIQAGFRGYQVRKQLKLKNGGTESINPRRSLRRKSSGKLRGSDGITSPKKPAKTADVEQSATKIQAGVRGFLVRRRQKKAKPTSESS